MDTPPMDQTHDDLYRYRCTTDKLLMHIARVEEAGDTVLWPLFVGGRDWILVCRRAGAPRPRSATVLIIDGAPPTIRRNDYLALIESVGFDVHEIKELRFAPAGIYATVIARGPDGRRVVVDDNTPATHEVFVEVVD